MNDLRVLILLAFAVLILLVPDISDGRGRRPGIGGGPGVSGGGGAKDDGADSGGSETERAAPSDADAGGPTDGLGDNRSDTAPKDPANAILDELRFHCDQTRRQCALERGRRLLWRSFDGGRVEVNGLIGLCCVPEHPGEEAEVAEGAVEDDGAK